MASSFMGLYVQREALTVAQKSQDITGNNLSNAQTAGYTRQRVDVCSVANTGYNLMYNTSVSLAGQGVEPVGVTQYRDALLDVKVRGYTSSFVDFSVKTSYMTQVETALDNIESEEFGLATNLFKFKEALQSFSTDNADRQEVANIACEAAKSVIKQMNYLDGRLSEVSEQILGDAKSGVKEINSILTSMGELNKQIAMSYVSMGYSDISQGKFEVDGEYGPLELKDKMNLYIDTLSEFAPVEVKEEANGSFTVSLAGQVVLYNDHFAQVSMSEADPAPKDMQFVVSSAGVYDPKTDKYSGLKDTDEWTKIAKEFDSTEAYVRDNLGNSIENHDGTTSPATKNISDTNTLYSGGLRGFLDVYNGSGFYAEPNVDPNYKGEDYYNNFQGVEFYRDMLNSLAETMTTEFNAVFEEDFGFGIFTYVNDEGVEDFHAAAKNFRVTDIWNDNPELISKPWDFDQTDSYNGKMEELNNTYVNKMLGVFNTPFTFGFSSNFNNALLSSTIDDATNFSKLEDVDFGFPLSKDADGKYSVVVADTLFSFNPTDSIAKVCSEISVKTKANVVFDEATQKFVFSNDDGSEFKNTSIKDTGFHNDPVKFTLEKYSAHITDNLGTQIESNNKLLETTTIMHETVMTARDEVSGVSISEEGINMMNYQKWYNAIARMITTLDQALEKLINGTGIVGL